MGVNMFLGLAIRREYLTYSFLYKDSLVNLGSILIKPSTNDEFSKFNSILSIIKSESLKHHEVSDDSSDNNSWSVGIYHDPTPSRHNFNQKNFYEFCRIKTILECASSHTLGTLPLNISESEICKAIAKISQSRISNIDDVVKYATSKLSNYLNAQPTLQLNALATSWATALALKRRATAESLVLGDTDTLKIREKLMSDRIVNELMTSINNRKGDKDDLKHVLKKRINKLVEDYVESIV